MFGKSISSILVAGAISLAPGASIAASFTVLHSFSGAFEGAHPYAGLTVQSGELFGTTYDAGGTAKMGTVFEFNPTTKLFTSLHRFSEKYDGGHPYAGLLSTDNVLYGTTFQGGSTGFGTLFKIDPLSQKLTTLHSFTSASDGGHPEGPPTMLGGNLYGTTFDGGNAPLAIICSGPIL